MKDPPKRSAELSVVATMVFTPPESPANGVALQALLEGLYVATDPANPAVFPVVGARNEPPTQSTLFFWSQWRADTGPLSPPSGSCVTLFVEDEYAAILAVFVPPRVVNVPPT